VNRRERKAETEDTLDLTGGNRIGKEEELGRRRKRIRFS